MPKIVANKKARKLLASPLLPDDITVNEWQAIVILANMEGAWSNDLEEMRSKTRKQKGDNAKASSKMSSDVDLSIAKIKQLIQFGIDYAAYVEVVDIPAFITVPLANYEDNVPDFLPRSTKTDENDVVTPRKWSEWKRQNTTHYVDGTDMIIPTNSATQEELAGSVLRALEQAGFDVSPMSQFPVQPE